MGWESSFTSRGLSGHGGVRDCSLRNQQHRPAYGRTRQSVLLPMWQAQGEPTGKFLIGTTGKERLGFSGMDDDHLYVFNIAQSGSNAGASHQLQDRHSSPVLAAQYRGSVEYRRKSDVLFSVNDTDTGFNPIEGYTIELDRSSYRGLGSPFSGVERTVPGISSTKVETFCLSTVSF